jgi:hypothetical protein
VRMCSPSPFFLSSPHHFPSLLCRIGFGEDYKNLVSFSTFKNCLGRLLRPRSIRAVRSLRGLPKVSVISFGHFMFRSLAPSGQTTHGPKQGVLVVFPFASLKSGFLIVYIQYWRGVFGFVYCFIKYIFMKSMIVWDMTPCSSSYIRRWYFS